MLRGRKQQQGSMLLVVVTTIMVIALAVLVNMVGDLTAGIGRRFSATDETLSRVQVALVSFVSTHQRLPCPADPTGANGPGWPDGVQPLALPASATSTCVYPGGVVPWNALGLTKDQVTDVWGRLISYRVYDGQFGLTQDKGASAVNCDTDNGSTPNVAPVATTGLCNNTGGLHDTLRSEFITHATFGSKGLNVHDFGPTPNSANVPNVAYVLISHGPSGHGGYTASGVRVPMPATDARDYANTQAAPAFFIKQAASAAETTSGTTGHFDDSIAYLKISDLLSLTKLDARDWPEVQMPSFDSVTTANLTSASTDPAAPHFMSSGQGDQAFVAVLGGTAIAGGIGSGSYSACLWWPRKLTLVSADTTRRALTTYIEFASVDTLNDAFPGFTLGYLAGTSSVSTAATGANGGSSIVVDSASGISVGMSVVGVGIATGATVTSIAGTTIGISPANTAIVSGTATFGAPTNITCGTSKSLTVTATGDAEQDELVVSNTAGISVGMNVFGDGIPFNTTVRNILVPGVGGTIRISEDTTADIAGSIDLSISRLVRRDIGWAGGTLAGYANRFAIEFDAISDIGTPGPPAVASAIDPFDPGPPFLSLPHLAVDFGGVTHGTDASSCATTSPGSGCDSELLPFPGVTKSATGSTGQSVVTITDVSGMYGIVHGMTATGSGIPSSTTVTAISGNLVTLSRALTGTVASVTFQSRSTNNFMQNGLSIFHGMRTEIYPRDCAAPAATGASGASTVTVTDASQIQPSMTVYGRGIGVGAVVPNSPFTLNLSTANSAIVSGPITITGGGSTLTFNATGSVGLAKITVSNVAGLVAGMAVSGGGIGTGATLSSIEVPLSAANSDAVASNIVFAGATAISTSGTGAFGSTSITVSNAAGIAAGMTAIGTGIATGAKVVSVTVGATSSVVELSVANTSAVFGSLKFLPEKALLKGWTLSNAGCNLDPSLCTAMKNVNAKLSYPGSSGVTTSATGSAGSVNIVVPSATGITLGMAVSGTGIANGAYVTGISISSIITISLSQPNTAAVSSIVAFDNRQILHTVSCIPAASVANAYDSLYFGITTANRTSGAAENTNGTGLAGSNQVTVSDPSGITLGMAVRGTGIANGATVTNIVGATLTLSAANTGVVSGSLSFAGTANTVFRALNVSTTALP
jgi:hypothetical protein